MAKIQGELALKKMVQRQLASGATGRAGDFVIGDKELLSKLASLGKQSAVNKMVRPGVREAASSVSRKAKSNVIEETGTLRKSIGSKSMTIAGSVVMAIVGPRRGMAREVERTMPDGSRRIVRADPALYAHLVEFGTAHHPPHPFMRPAWSATQTKRIITRRTRHELRKAAQGRVGRVKVDRTLVSSLRRAAR